MIRARLVSGGPWSMLGIIYAGTSNLLYGARPATGQGEGASRGNSAGLAHETTTAFQRRGDTMEPERREVDGCVRDESLDRGRGPERGGSLGARARARARSRQLCDPMRTRGEVVRTTGDELAHGGGGGGDWESRRGGRDELIGLAGAWTRLGGDSFGRGRWRQWARSGRTGLLASFQVASRGAGT